MDATKTQVRLTISGILHSFEIDNLELEIKLAEGLWALAHPTPGKRQPLSAALVKGMTLNSIHRGATKVEEIKEALWNRFHMYYPFDTRPGKAFLQFLVEHDTMGETVDQFADWWFEHDWRGQKKQSPDNIQIIMSHWPQAFVPQEIGVDKTGDGMDVFREAGFVIVGQ